MISGEVEKDKIELPLSALDILDVYRKFKDFRKYVYRAIDRMPRWVKNSEGRECIKDIRKCIRHLSLIARSKNTEVKLFNITEFILLWDSIADSISFFYEVSAISKHQRNVMVFKKYEIEQEMLELNNA